MLWSDDDNDDCTEKLIVIKSTVMNFYLISNGQSDIPRSGGFFPAKKWRAMAVKANEMK